MSVGLGSRTSTGASSLSSIGPQNFWGEILHYAQYYCLLSTADKFCAINGKSTLCFCVPVYGRLCIWGGDTQIF